VGVFDLWFLCGGRESTSSSLGSAWVTYILDLYLPPPFSLDGFCYDRVIIANHYNYVIFNSTKKPTESFCYRDGGFGRNSDILWNKNVFCNKTVL